MTGTFWGAGNRKWGLVYKRRHIYINFLYGLLTMTWKSSPGIILAPTFSPPLVCLPKYKEKCGQHWTIMSIISRMRWPHRCWKLASKQCVSTKWDAHNTFEQTMSLYKALIDVDPWGSDSCPSHFLDISSALPYVPVMFFSGTFQRTIFYFFKKQQLFLEIGRSAIV